MSSPSFPPFGSTPPPPPGGYGAPPPPVIAAASTKKGSKATKRLIDRNRVATIGFAVLAMIAVFVVQAGTKPSTTWVVTARTAIQQAANVDATSFQAIQIPTSAVEQKAFTGSSSASAVANAVKVIGTFRARVTVLPGAQVRSDQFGNPVKLTLDPPLGADERLISVSASVAQTVAGTVQAGDRVDILTVDSTGVGILATNITVVAATLPASAFSDNTKQGTSRNATLPTTSAPGTYVLRVKASMAAAFALADKATSLVFVLRGDGPGSDTNTGLVPITLLQLCQQARANDASSCH